MARRTFLHVGTPKTGTSYLQSVLWNNKVRLRQGGLLLPLTGLGMHYEAAVMVRGEEDSIARLREGGLRSWELALQATERFDGDVLISHELFAPTYADRAALALQQLHEVSDEVHVVVTARDLARQAPAEWQEETKHGATLTISDFYRRLQRADPEDWFWRVQDLVDVTARWSQGLDPSRMHVVTVPRPGGPSSLLWDRFAEVVGFDGGACDMTVSKGNASLGVVEAELLRRAGRFIPTDPRPQYFPWRWRAIFAEDVLGARPDVQKFAPPTEFHPWVVERGNAMVDELGRQGYSIDGELDDLRPDPEPLTGPHPDDVTDEQILPVALESFAPLVFSPEVPRLRARIERQEATIVQLRHELSVARRDVENARSLARAEIRLPLRSHLRRRAGRVKRALLRRPLP